MILNVYAVLIPLLLGLIAAEFVYCMWRRPEYYNFQDSMANLATAIGNQVVNVAVGVLVYEGYKLIQTQLSPWTIKPTLLSLTSLFIAIDFFFYWFHYAGHRINILWAAHSPHHSSEELNYTVGARASVTQRLASFSFYAPLALIGFQAEVLVPMILIHHVMQFWPHTRAIERMPAWFEKYFNAPSHHRVHHGCNDRYLDKNYGGFLIIWDKLFGTFEPESEPVIYGIRPPLGTWELMETNFYYYSYLWSVCKRTPRFIDKIKLWMMPLEWEPEGLKREKSGWKPEQQVKYATKLPEGAKLYMLSQLLPTIALLLLITRDDSPLSPMEKVLMGAVVWAAVITWGGFLEVASWAVKVEAARLALMPVVLAPSLFYFLPEATATMAALSLSALSAMMLWGCLGGFGAKLPRLRFKLPLL